MTRLRGPGGTDRYGGTNSFEIDSHMFFEYPFTARFARVIGFHYQFHLAHDAQSFQPS